MIYTVGHSTLDPESFVNLLTTHGVVILADVRSLPGSNRYPHFNQDRMLKWLPEYGIDYAHVPDLGGHRRPSKDGGYETVRNVGFRGYAQYTRTHDFERGIDRLLDLESSGPVAIMCAEAVWWRCHRSLVAEWLVGHNHDSRHIMPNGSLAQPGPRLL